MKFAMLTAFAVAAIYGQEFEVASIRAAPPPAGPRIRVGMDGGPGTGDPTTFSCRCSLSMLVMEAYGVKYFQVAGLGSREGELYDIGAKVPAGATREQFRVMLQKLIAERFGMTLHRGSREMQAYDLVVAKNGPKMKESVERVNLDQEGFPKIPAGQAGMVSVKGRARMQGIGETMPQLAARISNQLDLPVMDSTRLVGTYNFSLYWAAESDSSGPSIFSAVEAQLGLKLSSRKEAVPIVVVNHIDAVPGGN
jgi:uncharacterized protein (TIGR03435 family)